MLTIAAGILIAVFLLYTLELWLPPIAILLKYLFGAAIMLFGFTVLWILLSLTMEAL